MKYMLFFVKLSICSRWGFSETVKYLHITGWICVDLMLRGTQCVEKQDEFKSVRGFWILRHCKQTIKGIQKLEDALNFARFLKWRCARSGAQTQEVRSGFLSGCAWLTYEEWSWWVKSVCCCYALVWRQSFLQFLLWASSGQTRNLLQSVWNQLLNFAMPHWRTLFCSLFFFLQPEIDIKMKQIPTRHLNVEILPEKKLT